MFKKFIPKGGSKMWGRLWMINLFAALIVLILVSSCSSEREKPNFVYMPDMVYSPAYKSGEVGVMRPPVEGTVPRGYEPYAYPDDPEAAGRNLNNPLPRDEHTFAVGEERYNIYCAACHGRLGKGDGTVVPKFPKPPTLHSQKVRDWPDGRIYHVMTVGQNIMPSYASQVTRDERWAIVHYIRALQRALRPKKSDYDKVKELEE